ncbi:MAG TPA: hypothetical protein VLH86_02400 [Patescibacteria group bacterium]|nr:hypothetical protein [Patescibacteria group bacterium]
MTPHGLRKLEGERADLNYWLGRLKMRATKAIADRKNKEIGLILSEEHVVEDRLDRIDTILGRASVPNTWGHKAEVRVGDTVYLRHKKQYPGSYADYGMERRPYQWQDFGYVPDRLCAYWPPPRR